MSVTSADAVRPRNDDAEREAAIAAAAAEAARQASKQTDPALRAAAGWTLANRPQASATDAAVANAGTNARTALTRTDLPAAQTQQLRATVEHLGTALVDGRIDPHVNSTFRQHLYALATEPADSAQFRGALAQMSRAASVLDQVELASGTRLGYDVAAGQQVRGLPVLDVPDIDADLYFRTHDGTLHVESVKNNPGTLANELLDRRGALSPQLQRQATWLGDADVPGARAFGVGTLEDGPGFNHLLDDRRLDQLDRSFSDPEVQRYSLGDRRYSLDDLRGIASDIDADALRHVDAARAQHVASGATTEFDRGAAFRDYYRGLPTSASETAQRYGGHYGTPNPTLERLPATPGPSLAQGGALGAGVAGGFSAVQALSDGRLTPGEAIEVGRQTAIGGGAGAATVALERVVTPAIDRVAVAPLVQRATTSAASTATTTAVAEAGASRAAALGTIASRAAGATVAGAVVTAGISAVENRDGLMRGDSQAIGNVAADTTVAAGSIAAATLTGAAIGSVVPVAGTAVGAVAGLLVGVGLTYGAQVSGVRDAIADGVSDVVDGIKSWF